MFNDISPSRKPYCRSYFFTTITDVYDNFKKCVKPDELNVTTRILGGGWLEHGDESILIEGASVAESTKNHEIHGHLRLLSAFYCSEGYALRKNYGSREFEITRMNIP
ncbi:Hypothetical protein CINCED_3A009892 [Cinara cedri]|uniref:Uncharacterized protein n=1 Tax=Cinara cedri TaxID=506608 RepID=A0A5E4MZB1_9HEMI|nr:Hypothetical protein CINCED_3A009892 [Cinara cedri]